MTFGATDPPVEIYEGATARKAVRQDKALATSLRRSVIPDGEINSLGNVSRGDTI